MGTDKMEEKHRAQLNPGCSINANAPKAELPPNYFNAVGNFPMAADREEQLSFRQKGTAGASREACDTGNQITAGAPPDSGNGPFLFHLQPHPTLQPQEFPCFLRHANGSTVPTSHAVVKPGQQPRHQQDTRVFCLNGKHLSQRHGVARENIVQPEEPEGRAEKVCKVGEIPDNDIGCVSLGRKERNGRDEVGRNRSTDTFEYKHKRVAALNASDTIRRQLQAEQRGEGFPVPAAQVSTDNKNAVKVVRYPLFEKVKARLSSQDTYQEFLKCLNMFNQKIIRLKELQSLVGDIIGKHADLLKEFNELLMHCENVEGYLAGVFSERKLGDFAEQLNAVKTDGERDKNSNKEKFVTKPISELDLSNCQRCTPSYRLLPKEYRKPVSSHRTALANSVLNDNWVSTSENRKSFRVPFKNQYEVRLFKCEDDQNKLDVQLETITITAAQVGQYIQKQNGENRNSDALPPVEEFFSSTHLKCIKAMYKDVVLDTLQFMKNNTSVAMPKIHHRLLRKENEWKKKREKMNKGWSKVYRENVHKALIVTTGGQESKPLQDKKASSKKSQRSDDVNWRWSDLWSDL